jgi:hypothetical protein
LVGKTITDPLYGNIQLTRLESELVSSTAFQRLHNVKQLGLGNLVFPSAGYSRFAHSVGACVNADRILTAIESNSNKKFSNQERQAFRIAGLFHDLGHYPFSHTTEHAVKRFYRDGIFRRSKENPKQAPLPIIADEFSEHTPAYLDHEDTGKLIFLEDEGIARAFAKADCGITKEQVELAYLSDGLSTIISSDLDCDRMDYLKRTSHHSGAPYGAVDVDFLISKATIDGEGRFCYDSKAIRAADHLLMSRFYDFLQIPFHKTVASLEWSLEEAVLHLLKTRTIDMSEEAIRKMVTGHEWAYFDDARMLELMRASAHADSATDQIAIDHIRAVLDRRPAKCVYFWEALVTADNNEQDTREELLKLKIEEIARSMGLERERFHVWKVPFKLAKAGPILQRRPAREMEASDEEAQQLIQILDGGTGKAKPLIDLPNTVSHHLSQLKYQVLRVYYLQPSKTDAKTLQEIEQRFH